MKIAISQEQIKAARQAYVNALSRGEDYALVQAITAVAVVATAAATERCAKVADRFAGYHASELACHPAIRHQIKLVAAAIRALP